MNEASELSRDMGLLEQSIRMTTSEMQADYADYELTLLSEKKNQVIGHIDELLREAIERHSELSAVRADVLSEVKHYESEYKRAHAAKLNAQRFFGKDSEQAFDHLSRFRFACEMHEKAQKQLTGIDFDLSEMFALINTLRTFLTGETPSVIATESDDLPFASEQPAATATALSMETFEALAKKHVTDIICYVERHRDLRDETEDALTEGVITEISRGKVSVNDIFQSFDEVLEDEFAGFYEALEAAQETDKATLQHELAASVEAYA